MRCYLMLQSISVPHPRKKKGLITVAAATYSQADGARAASTLPSLPYQHGKDEAWKWEFGDQGLLIQSYDEVPAECNWVVVVTHVHDESQAGEISKAADAAIADVRTDVGGTPRDGESRPHLRDELAVDAGIVLAKAIETAVHDLLFKPTHLGTFIGSAHGKELHDSWTRTEDRNPQPASITLAWDVDRG